MATKTKIFNFLINNLETGAQLSLTDIQNIISNEFDKSLSERTIQRYMKELIDEYPHIESFIKKNKRYIKIPNDLRSSIQTFGSRPDSNHLIALHFLKSHLVHFKNTKVEEYTEELIGKLEKEFGVDEDIFAFSLESKGSLHVDGNIEITSIFSVDKNLFVSGNLTADKIHFESDFVVNGEVDTCESINTKNGKLVMGGIYIENPEI